MCVERVVHAGDDVVGDALRLFADIHDGGHHHTDQQRQQDGVLDNCGTVLADQELPDFLTEFFAHSPTHVFVFRELRLLQRRYRNFVLLLVVDLAWFVRHGISADHAVDVLS